jgi:hypothetical protein
VTLTATCGWADIIAASESGKKVTSHRTQVYYVFTTIAGEGIGKIFVPYEAFRQAATAIKRRENA